jgi:hypothetical protein
VAFCGSILLSIWVFGLRDKFSSEETASAYSVFNEDGKAIVGGLTAGQFDRQLRGGFAPPSGSGSGSNDDNNDNPVRGSIAVSEHKSNAANAKDNKLGENERLRRRTAAAAAAERRFQT